MPYEGLGRRFVVAGNLAGRKACVHGQIVSEGGIVGTAFKTKQVSWNTLPAAADDIAIDEEFVMELLGVAEAPATGALATAAPGAAATSDVYITTTTNALVLAAGGITGAALNANMLPVGKVVEVDTVRTPDVVRINLGLAHLVKGNWA